MAAVGCTACSQLRYAVVEVPLKMSVAPNVTAFSDAVLVEQEPSRETRRRLALRFHWREGRGLVFVEQNLRKQQKQHLFEFQEGL